MQSNRSIRGDTPTVAANSLLLTGRRWRDRSRVDVGGAPLWLPHAPFDALVKLAAARFRRESGFAKIDRLTIHRLRKALGYPGKALIVNGSGEEYRLALSKAQAAKQIKLAPCFFELAELDFIAKEDADLLRKHCRTRKLADDDDGILPPLRNPKGNRKETKRKPNGN